MKTIALSIAIFAIPLTSTAQDSRQSQTAIRSIEVHSFQDQFTQRLHMAALEEQQDLYRDSISPRRVHRAEQAAELINRGDCEGARTLALRANDARMLARIEHACRAQDSSN